ncbi:PTS mannitol transporter subunit IICBA [Saccharibacillus kuerlensis]|uniref:Mannitol-specific phosphotransferase enzyme IIA component n=1 Tax=Saccharibacillus kuerlensis TaxID=459527 RepID=A0ABQ2L4Z0_9BACL|nr:PTS mannitol transporter subunit IICBA [Saccharibacillus kuerlensis]GGO00143.1 PTS system mannitol-specific EIICBA component [Saccharibacillus kuerlensis]
MSSVSTPAKSGGARQGVQKFGRFLSAMVMPNIGAFIAWGLLTALFIPDGYFPNKEITSMIDPMITYLLPLLIAYSGGKMFADHRGGVIAAIATMGVIVGAGDIKMFIGAMVMGPLAGWLIKLFDRAIEGKIPAGFEMLINNFSLGIFGAILAVGGYYGIGPLIGAFTQILESGVQTIVSWGVLPLVSIFVEPGKILFLNNAINHGIFSPLGLEESQRLGQSIFFLIESNPGPGLGVLLAYLVFAKGSIRSSAPGAIIIHFVGGIHEIYFPYVLMKPALILSVILGGMAGVFTFVLTGAGLVSAASPGSIIALMLVSPKGGQLEILAGVAAATLVSFLVSAFFLRNYKANDEDLAKAREASQAMKSTNTAGSTGGSTVRVNGKVEKIVFACDAGMGSSAMGASSFRKKVKAAGLPINVTNTAIENIPADADIVVTQQNLTDRARAKAPNAHHVSIDNFINNPVYEDLIEELKAAESGPSPAERNTTATTGDAQWDIDNALDKAAPQNAADHAAEQRGTAADADILRKENIYLGLPSVSKEDAIREAGRLLSASGYVRPGYVDAMLEREGVASTYIGNGVAIPHGVGTAKNEIENSGIVVLQYPNGVEFEAGTAYLVIGIAGARGEHLKILTKIAEAIEDESTVQRLSNTKDVNDIYNTLSVQPE